MLKTGNVYMDCGEGCDVSDLELAGSQVKMVEELSKLGKPIIAIMVQGRPYAIEKVSKLSSALLMAWYPGQEGATAVADTLIGINNPSGRLCVSVPRRTGQLPVNYNRRETLPLRYVNTENSPLYTFGDGMSYSKIEYSNVTCSGDRTVLDVENGGKVKITVDVKNASERSAKETVLLYLSAKGRKFIERKKELKAYKKISLAAGETKTVEFYLGKEEFTCFSVNKKEEVVPASFTVLLGQGEENTAKFELK